MYESVPERNEINSRDINASNHTLYNKIARPVKHLPLHNIVNVLTSEMQNRQPDTLQLISDLSDQISAQDTISQQSNSEHRTGDYFKEGAIIGLELISVLIGKNNIGEINDATYEHLRETIPHSVGDDPSDSIDSVIMSGLATYNSENAFDGYYEPHSNPFRANLEQIIDHQDVSKLRKSYFRSGVGTMLNIAGLAQESINSKASEILDKEQPFDDFNVALAQTHWSYEAYLNTSPDITPNRSAFTLFEDLYSHYSNSQSSAAIRNAVNVSSDTERGPIALMPGEDNGLFFSYGSYFVMPLAEKLLGEEYDQKLRDQILQQTTQPGQEKLSDKVRASNLIQYGISLSISKPISRPLQNLMSLNIEGDAEIKRIYEALKYYRYDAGSFMSGAAFTMKALQDALENNDTLE